eukprot:TRINITY_DN11311_c0_g2_i1.p1 TRINITY_DN11311_c0_g2~~TRINITY_DN11311_c0_g2_i1.p1  ORF type:complete len:232 (-),score=44.17 TRINITY_DN11311_c0_g2_i1:291-986(-)
MFRSLQRLRNEHRPSSTLDCNTPTPEPPDANADALVATTDSREAGMLQNMNNGSSPAAMLAANEADALQCVARPCVTSTSRHRTGSRLASEGSADADPVHRPTAHEHDAPGSRLASEGIEDADPVHRQGSGDADPVHTPTTNESDALQVHDQSVLPPDGVEQQVTCEFLPGMYRPLWSNGPWVTWNCPEDLAMGSESDDDDSLYLLDELEWDELDIEDAMTTCSSEASFIM